MPLKPAHAEASYIGHVLTLFNILKKAQEGGGCTHQYLFAYRFSTMFLHIERFRLSHLD